MKKTSTSNYLYIPTKNGAPLHDSQGKPRMYKTIGAAIKNLEHLEYDEMVVYQLEDVVSREEFEVGSK
jgi:hypothetical protein